MFLDGNIRIGLKIWREIQACLAGLHRRERFGQVAKSADYTCGVHSSANANLDIFSSLLHHDTCAPLRVFSGMWDLSTLWGREVFQQNTDKASASVAPHAWIYMVFIFNWHPPENVSRLTPPKFAWTGSVPKVLESHSLCQTLRRFW